MTEFDIIEKPGTGKALRRRERELASLVLLLFSASCVPLKAAQAPTETLAQAAIPAAPSVPTAPLPELPEPEAVPTVPSLAGDAAALNAAIPISATANPRAAATVFRAGTAWDRQRSLQCLAEAVYYEARSEGWDGQRAVAQVVLNRVRHPAYPGSVCGVVYQGPMRAGGGCQFTFTCDGSLALPPSGPGWARARVVAAAALAGSVYAPVGLSTHYHTHQVLPSWAYRLVKSAVVGSHNFYRLQGSWGQPAAFSQRYAGREPMPAVIMAARPPTVATTPILAWSAPSDLPGYAAQAVTAPPPPADNLPQSRIRPEYANSGAWRAAPTSAQ